MSTVIQQTLVPVMGDTTRILGTVALDAPTTFDGTEITVEIQGKTYTLKRYDMIRTKDVVAIEFMGIPMSGEEERAKMFQHIPGFADVTSNTLLDTWKDPGVHTIEPRTGLSAWEKFLANLPAKEMAILSPMPHLQDA